jgi:hypothetical protein
MSQSTLSQRLNDSYFRILENNQDFKEICEFKHDSLSGLFLAGIPENFDIARPTLLVLGRETRGWAKNFDPNQSLPDYIKYQADKAVEYLKNRSEISKNEKGSSFHNFLRKLPKDKNLIWANLYCYSWNKSAVANAPIAQNISNISYQLLKSQIDLIRPKYIVLAHGVSNHSIELRRRLFSPENCKTLSNPLFNDIENDQLWMFEYQRDDMNYQIECLRIQHPSSFSKKSRRTREAVISYLQNVK